MFYMVLENFIVFEGIDGAGTSTQLKKLIKRCPSARLSISAEPTPGPTGLFLRRMLAGEFTVDVRTAAYLFAADRCEHLYGKNGIFENLAAGKLVVSDRYFFSSLAYQSVTCGRDLPRILNSTFPLPSILFYFKIPPELSLARVEKRGEKLEIYENSTFLQKTALLYDEVIAEYNKIPLAETMQTVTLDAAAPIDKTAEIIWNHLENMPILKM